MRLSGTAALKAALGASLALNLVLAGVMFWPKPPPQHGIRGMQARIERVLSPADQEAFRAVMRANAPRYEGAEQEMRQSRPEITLAIGAEPFSEQGLRQAMAASRTKWRAFSEAYEDSLAQAIAVISPEGRRRLLADSPENR